MTCNAKANRQMWPEFELISDLIAILVICKFDDNPIKKKKKALLCSHNIYPIISLWEKNYDAQGQVIPQQRVRFGRKSNLSEILYLPLLPSNQKRRRHHVDNILSPLKGA